MDTSRNLPAEGKEIINNISVSGFLSPFAWSPDDSKIVFSGVKSSTKETGQDIFTVSISDNKVREIVSQPGRDRDPQWSPDGSKIIFTSDMAKAGLDGWNNKLAVVPATGGIPHSITESFDENPRLVKWNKDGIYFWAFQKMTSHLFRLNPETNSFIRIALPDDLITGGFSLSENGNHLSFSAVSPTSINEVYVYNINNYNTRQLTNISNQISRYYMSKQEMISWKSSDGLTIEGVLTKPKDFRSNKKYPLLVIIHGGPTEVSQPALLNWLYYPIDLWVNRGALVLQVNYRGSAGYGKEFRKIAYRSFDMEAEDIFSGIEYLNQKGWVDTSRMGSMGWSHGGYLTAFISTTTNKFKAVSVGAGITDWSIQYYAVANDVALNYFGSSPVNDPEIYKRLSPITHIKQCVTPTLIQHGDRDQTCPIQHGYTLYNALKGQNIKTEMIVYNGFGHGIGKPKTLMAATEHNLYWFNHYIFGDPLPDFSKLLSKNK